MAGGTYTIGFLLACLGIIADSQLHAELELSAWLQGYLEWGLPVAPAIMALGALLSHELSPTQLRARQESIDKMAFTEQKFQTHLASLWADMQAQRTIQNVQIKAKTAAAKQIADWYTTEQAQQAISATARQNAPALLRSAGINITPENPKPIMTNESDISEDLASFLHQNPNAISQIQKLIELAQKLDAPKEPNFTESAIDIATPSAEEPNLNGENASPFGQKI